MINYIVNIIEKLGEATRAGALLVFGELGNSNCTFILALQALPMVILTAVLFRGLYYTNVLPCIAKVFSKAFKIPDYLSIGAITKMFFGQFDTLNAISPYFQKITERHTLFILSSVFATSSVAVFPAYASILKMPNVMHLLVSSNILNVIVAYAVTYVFLLFSKNKEPTFVNAITAEDQKTVPHLKAKGLIQHLVASLEQGTKAWLAIIGSLLGVTALITLVNDYLMSGYLTTILGVTLRPVAWILDIHGTESTVFGEILSIKIVGNEILAMSQLNPELLSPISLLKTIYMLNNFGNISVIAVTASAVNVIANNSPFPNYVIRCLPKAWIIGFISTIIGCKLWVLLGL